MFKLYFYLQCARDFTVCNIEKMNKYCKVASSNTSHLEALITYEGDFWYLCTYLLTKNWFPNFYINWLLVVGGRWRIVKPPYQTSFFFVCFCRCISKTIFRGHLWPPTTWSSWQQGRSGHDTQWPLLPWRGLIYYSRPTPSSESGLCTLGWTQWLYMSCVIASSNPRYTN